MKPPHLLVPKEIAQSPKDVAKYADVLETCVKNAYAPEEFLSRCRDEGLNITATDAHIALYKELVRLDKENKNGIWARIIKNNFAPLFVGRVDYVAGNPPWINWENLPQNTATSLAPYGTNTAFGGVGENIRLGNLSTKWQRSFFSLQRTHSWNIRDYWVSSSRNHSSRIKGRVDLGCSKFLRDFSRHFQSQT